MAQFDVTAVFKISGLSQLNTAFKQIGTQANRVGRDFQRFGNDAGRFTNNIVRAGTAAGIALAGAATRFSQFQDQFSEVVTLLDQGSFSTETLEQGVSGLEEGILSLRGSTGETFQNLNKGLFDLVSATGDAENGIANLTTATDLAIAGATETSIAVDGITSVLGAFGDAAGNAEEISQKFFLAQKAGKTDVEQIARSVGLVASQANAAGIGFEELLATVSSATVAGIRTNAAFTGLRGAIDNIQKPTAQAREEAERLGIEFDATALRTNGLIGVLEAASNSAGFTEESFVKLFGSVEARNFALAIARENFEGANDILKDLNNETLAASTFNTALAERQDTLAFSTNRLIGLFDTLVVRIGKALSPAIKVLFQLLGDLIEEFQPEIIAFFEGFGNRAEAFLTRLRENFPELVKQIRSTIKSITEGFKSFFEGLKIGLGAVIFVFQTFIGMLDTVGQALFGVNGITLATTLALLQFSGALRLIVSSGILLVSLLRLFGSILSTLVIPSLIKFGTTFGLINAVLLPFRAALVAVALALGLLRIALISIPFVAIGVVLLAIIEQFVDWEKVIQSVKDAFDRVKSAFADVSQFILDKLSELGFEFESLTDFIPALFDGAVRLIASALIGLIGFINEDFGEQVAESFTRIWDRVKEIVAGVFREITGIFTGFISSVTGFFSSLKREADESKNQFEQVRKETEGIKKQADELSRIQPKSGSILDPNVTRSFTVGGARIVNPNTFGSLSGFNTGGAVHGKGTSTSDSILARLSRGEYVVKAASVKKFGLGFMNAINSGVVPAIKGFADGGLVDAIKNSTTSLRLSGGIPSATATPQASFAATGRPINLQIPGAGSFRVYSEESEAQRLQRQLRSTDMKSSADKPGWVR